MFKYLLVVFAIATIANARALNETDASSRIVNGEPIDITQRPYQVAILKNGGFLCGGAIINRNTVLTAAHCTGASADVYTIRAGSTQRNSGGVVVKVKEYIRHPNYGNMPSKNDYDVSIVKLAEPLEFTDKIARIAPAGPDFKVPDGAIATVSGWGLTLSEEESPFFLRQASVPIINQDQCRKTFPGITERMICAGNEKGTCSGDSGGPLVYNGRHIGIVSFGADCSKPYPGVLARTGALKEFIDAHA